MKRKILLMITVLASVSGYAQEKDRAQKYLEEGNRHYKDSVYSDAIKNYKKALELSPGNKKAGYNLGNAYYQSGQYDSSSMMYEKALENARNAKERTRASYNLGNSQFQKQKYEESIASYKKALRENPNDEDARYNLAYAQRMLKKQQQQQQQQNQNQNQNQNKENKDPNKPQDPKEKDKQNRPEDPQNKKDQDKPENNNDKPENPNPQPDKIDKKQAQQLLDALNASEKKLQDKLRKKEATIPKPEKDW